MAERERHDLERIRRLNRVITSYYAEGLTQAEIGRQLGMSTSTVNRLIRQARDQGMVQITIRTPFQSLFDLETRLRDETSLDEAIVIPALASDNSNLPHTLGRAAAEHLLETLKDGDVLAIGGGTAVHATVQALHTRRSLDVRVVPCMGAVQGSVTTDVNYLASELASRLGGTPYQLHAPAFVNTEAERKMLETLSPVREILDIARKATVALVGIGTIDYQTSRFVQFTALSPEDMQSIALTCGGVGEIAAHVFDASGRPCAEAYSKRTVGLTLQELRSVPRIIGVAGSKSKVQPLIGALRGGYLDTLITDEVAARGVLELDY